MHDQTEAALPERRRNGAPQERRKNHIGLPQLHGLARDVLVNIEFDGQIVAILGEFHVQPLRQAVERVHQQQDAHQPATGSTPRRYL